jgi:hypothetical protein
MGWQETIPIRGPGQPGKERHAARGCDSRRGNGRDQPAGSRARVERQELFKNRMLHWLPESRMRCQEKSEFSSTVYAGVRACSSGRRLKEIMPADFGLQTIAISQVADIQLPEYVGKSPERDQACEGAGDCARRFSRECTKWQQPWIPCVEDYAASSQLFARPRFLAAASSRSRACEGAREVAADPS